MSSARALTGAPVEEWPRGFEARWYRLGEQRHGPFRDMQDLAEHMHRHGLPRPDELLVPL